MRFYGIALLAGAAILGACGGENKSATDTAAANAAATSPTTPAAATPAATDRLRLLARSRRLPATGTTHEVKMIGDATGYKFEPGQHHRQVGRRDQVHHGLRRPAQRGVPDHRRCGREGPARREHARPAHGRAVRPDGHAAQRGLHVSFGKIPAGKYDFICIPHARDEHEGLDHGSVVPSHCSSARYDGVDAMWHPPRRPSSADGLLHARESWPITCARGTASTSGRSAIFLSHVPHAP